MPNPPPTAPTAPNQRTFALNSDYGLWLLGPEQEQSITLRVPSDREPSPQRPASSEAPPPKPTPSPRT